MGHPVVNHYLVKITSDLCFLTSNFYFLVDCQWSKWGAWGNCLGDCGLGKRVRRRFIEKPQKNGGHPCIGNDISEESCQLSPCKVPQINLGLTGENLAVNSSIYDSNINISATENNNYGYTHPQAAHPQPAQPQPAQPQPTHPQPAHPQPVHSQPSYPQPAHYYNPMYPFGYHPYSGK